eukprot:gnl/TRDRNA2_/TRDRNA2_43105_c0_seq1.p1 gnl/TRDRNA2_/TRDRNA2_43105_c0~~gnl/TRDRNA2_/TRDRNA2_43105_c0_seq1.p1  ORF type:complete len:402 (+),score=16.39 gnl/TRDRNA2_/TRDRNA2_43105_c0_seq1:41-1246(+)
MYPLTQIRHLVLFVASALCRDALAAVSDSQCKVMENIGDLTLGEGDSQDTSHFVQMQIQLATQSATHHRSIPAQTHSPSTTASKTKSQPLDFIDFVTGGSFVHAEELGWHSEDSSAEAQWRSVERVWHSPHLAWRWLSADNIRHCLEKRPLMFIGDSTVRMTLHDLASILFFNSSRRLLSDDELKSFGQDIYVEGFEPPEMRSVERTVEFSGCNTSEVAPCNYFDRREVFTSAGNVATWKFLPSSCCLVNHGVAWLRDLATSLQKDPAVIFYGGTTAWDQARFPVLESTADCKMPGEQWESFSQRSSRRAISVLRDYVRSLNQQPFVISRSGPDVVQTFNITQEQDRIERPLFHEILPEAGWFDYVPILRNFGNENTDFLHPVAEAQRSITMVLLNIICPA